MDIEDLKRAIVDGNTLADAAERLCRAVDEVLQKAQELGLDFFRG